MNKTTFNRKAFKLAIIVAVMVACLLFNASPACGQTKLPDQKAQMCRERIDKLNDLTQKPPNLRQKIAEKEKTLKQIVSPSPAMVEYRLQQATDEVRILREKIAGEKNSELADAYANDLKTWREILDYWTKVKTASITGGAVSRSHMPAIIREAAERLEKELDDLKREQTELGREIFLLREQIESLGCTEKPNDVRGGTGESGGLNQSSGAGQTVTPKIEEVPEEIPTSTTASNNPPKVEEVPETTFSQPPPSKPAQPQAEQKPAQEKKQNTGPSKAEKAGKVVGNILRGIMGPKPGQQPTNNPPPNSQPQGNPPPNNQGGPNLAGTWIVTYTVTFYTETQRWQIRQRSYDAPDTWWVEYTVLDAVDTRTNTRNQSAIGKTNTHTLKVASGSGNYQIKIFALPVEGTFSNSNYSEFFLRSTSGSGTTYRGVRQ